MDSGILVSLEEKKISKDTLYERVLENFSLLPKIIEGVDSTKASVRYGCSKILVDLSGKCPEKLYPYMDQFFGRLESKHRIIVWNALAIIGNLASVDSDRKIDAQFKKICDFMNSEYMVTVANLIDCLGKIGQAKPCLISKITSELLRVEKLNTTPHLTEECKRVLAGKALKTFDVLIRKMDAKDKLRVISFAERNRKSTRKKLSYEADLFLRKWSNTK